MHSTTNICWIRRDLRLTDHNALSQALKDDKTILIFIFDKNILGKLNDKNDQRVSFIYDSLKEVEKQLQNYGSSLIISYGDPKEELPRLAKMYQAKRVYCNRDYEPYAKKRDAQVEKELNKINIDFITFKDSVLLEKNEVLTKTHQYFKVFTPYKKRWLEVFEEKNLEFISFDCELKNLVQLENPENILDYNWYQVIGFNETPPTLAAGRSQALKRINEFKKIISSYDRDRNYPSLQGTSLLSVYIRHGNISIREVVRLARRHRDPGHQTWLSEIIWRDFYQMILDAYPHVEKRSFKKEYDKIKYLGTEKNFISWCRGQTGFPLVDAAMRCLNETGLMHNRLRMLCASFLCKILLVDWRKGEEYFANKLLDYDLAANNGGWQWSSSSGCDAQPYFRIFNPYSQSLQYDEKGEFIHQWIPELNKLSGKELHHPNRLTAPTYPCPIVNYEINRKKCLIMYSVIKNK